MPLWIVATPIGTLDDLSPRARAVLASAARICAEDTRVTRRLLSAVGIACPPLDALHAHNEEQVAERVVAAAQGADIVLVSDAGTPGISDPGRHVVEAALAAGVSILSVPGPSALATALAASGLPAAPSTFQGFPPRKGRDGWVAQVLTFPGTIVMYEAPTRSADLVRRLAAAAPHREGVLCRELSKRYEEVLRAPLPALAALLEGRELRGECVVCVGPGDVAVVEAETVGADASLKDIAAVLATRWGCTKREAYQRLLALEQPEG